MSVFRGMRREGVRINTFDLDLDNRLLSIFAKQTQVERIHEEVARASAIWRMMGHPNSKYKSLPEAAHAYDEIQRQNEAATERLRAFYITRNGTPAQYGRMYGARARAIANLEYQDAMRSVVNPDAQSEIELQRQFGAQRGSELFQAQRQADALKQFKWLKPIAKAIPAIGKYAPEIAEGLSGGAPTGVSLFKGGAGNAIAGMLGAAGAGFAIFQGIKSLLDKGAGMAIEGFRLTGTTQNIAELFGGRSEKFYKAGKVSGLGSEEQANLRMRMVAMAGKFTREPSAIADIYKVFGRHGIEPPDIRPGMSGEELFASFGKSMINLSHAQRADISQQLGFDPQALRAMMVYAGGDVDKSLSTLGHIKEAEEGLAIDSAKGDWTDRMVNAIQSFFLGPFGLLSSAEQRTIETARALEHYNAGEIGGGSSISNDNSRSVNINIGTIQSSAPNFGGLVDDIRSNANRSGARGNILNSLDTGAVN